MKSGSWRAILLGDGEVALVANPNFKLESVQRNAASVFAAVGTHGDSTLPAVMLSQSDRFFVPHLSKVPEERLLALHALVRLLPKRRLIPLDFHVPYHEGAFSAYG